MIHHEEHEGHEERKQENHSKGPTSRAHLFSLFVVLYIMLFMFFMVSYTNYKERSVFAKMFWIAVAGAAGTLARYGLSGWVQSGTKGILPLGTLAVNLVGCLVFGAVASAMMTRWAGHAELRSIFLIGFMGAFTTFSTFMFETSELVRDGQWFWAMGNVAAQNVLGLVAVVAGMALGRLV